MKGKRMDLTLFGEGEGESSGDRCAAEQTSSESVAVTEAMEGGSTDLTAESDSTLRSIAELLGIEYKGENELLESLRQRRARASLSEKLRERKSAERYRTLLSDMKSLSESHEGHDLRAELSDSRCVALLRAGFSLDEAYRMIHMEELLENARREARDKALSEAYETLRKASERPVENGAAGKASAKSQKSVEGLTGRSIRDILRRVENGAKIRF